MKFNDFGYHDLGHEILNNGTWEYNERTGKNCKLVTGAMLKYHPDFLPIVTTRKSFWKAAVAELLGYIKGYTNAQDFADLGAKTWYANANETKAWLENPNRKGENDIGFCYGAIGHNFGGIDLFEKVYNNLKNGIDDRSEIITFYKPDEFDKACLRPCLYSHHFVKRGEYLDLISTQRSCDVPLGLNFNMVQVYVFLAIMAQITGFKAGVCTHNIANAHVYEDQYDLFKVQMSREPLEPKTKLFINPEIKTLDDVINKMTVADFSITEYDHHDPIKYPFSE